MAPIRLALIVPIGRPHDVGVACSQLSRQRVAARTSHSRASSHAAQHEQRQPRAVGGVADPYELLGIQPRLSVLDAPPLALEQRVPVSRASPRGVSTRCVPYAERPRLEMAAVVAGRAMANGDRATA